MELNNNNFKFYKLIKARYLIAVTFVMAVLIFGTFFIEFQTSKEDYYKQLFDYSNSLVSTINLNAENTVLSDREIEALLTTHLLGVAHNIARLDSISVINNNILKTVAQENNVYRINIFNGDGIRIYTNSSELLHNKNEEKHKSTDYIQNILNGKEDQIIIGLKEARFEKGKRYAVAIKRLNNRKGAIVVNLDAESYLEFRKKTGFGKMIQDIGNSEGIEYIMLQNYQEIIAANKNVNTLASIKDDLFLQEAMKEGIPKTREINFNGNRIYEIINKFDIDSITTGLFRIGLKMDHLEIIESKMYRRFVYSTIVLIVLSVSVISLIIINQNYKIIKGEYNKVKTYTGDILENMSQSVITINKDGLITIFNKNSEVLFNKKSFDVIDKKIDSVLGEEYFDLLELIKNKKEIKKKEITFNNGKTFLVSTNLNKHSKEIEFYFTLVIEDITDLKEMEYRNKLDEKLVAMGELASTVAHEVRNPLNTINMIAQRIYKQKDELLKNKDETNSMTQILRSESERVNNIIEQFLKYSKPPVLQLRNISSKDFLKDIVEITKMQTQNKNIIISTNDFPEIQLLIDSEQMKQAILNLVKNSIEAIDNQGEIKIFFSVENGKKIFKIIDNGTGIKQSDLKKIFNLYYTTKQKGSGLGLSIVQQIISQHNGSLKVESSIGKGTIFSIILP